MSSSHPQDNLLPLPLPEGVTSNHVSCPLINLSFHYLEAGYSPTTPKPLLLLLHGYPEVAFSWRKILPHLASQNYHVVAPDQPGYGRTTGWDTRPYHETDLSGFTMTRLVRDLVVFVAALGHKKVHCVIGHDFGAVSAATCALIRPDIFSSLIIMSHPLKLPPSLPFATARSSPRTADPSSGPAGTDISTALAHLDPPRKHYKWYHSSPSAAHDMLSAPQGLKAFLRGYFHTKSASYTLNAPHALPSWSAEELAKMPGYYVMPLHASMPETIASLMEAENPSATTSWLPEPDLDVYVQEWRRTGFQGGLNWYRAQTDEKQSGDLLLFGGRKIVVPMLFLSGEKDWGNYQQPGALEGMGEGCEDFRGVRFVSGAGHWPQQERPGEVVHGILEFLEGL